MEDDNVIYVSGPSVREQLVTAGIGILASIALFLAFIGFGAAASGIEKLKQKRRDRKLQKAAELLRKENSEK